MGLSDGEGIASNLTTIHKRQGDFVNSIRTLQEFRYYYFQCYLTLNFRPLKQIRIKKGPVIYILLHSGKEGP